MKRDEHFRANKRANRLQQQRNRKKLKEERSDE